MLDRRVAKGWLPDALLRATERGSDALVGLPAHLAARVRLVPAVTATGGGVLMALVPDGAFLEMKGTRRAAELLVAPISLATNGGEYQALLPAALLTE